MTVIDGVRPHPAPALLPHQTDFVSSVLSPASKRVVVLRGAPGLGKTAALAALASRILQAEPAARVVVLCPAPLRQQWVSILSSRGAHAVPVDRYRFRELLDSTAANDPWPKGSASVLSYEFAMQPDIVDSLASSRWELLIADEGHRIADYQRLFGRIEFGAKRIVIASRLELPVESLNAGETDFVEWDRRSLVDLAGKPLDVVPRPTVTEVLFALSPSEQGIWRAVEGLTQALMSGIPQRAFSANNLIHSFRSSPAALEAALRRLATATDELLPTAEFEEADEGMAEMHAEGLPDLAVEDTVRNIATGVLQELETLQEDSKLSAFDELMNSLTSSAPPDGRVCVVTKYVSTLYYLAAEMERQGLTCSRLFGSMSMQDRANSLDHFRNNGGVLAATQGVMVAGVHLPGVTDLVFYDLPRTEPAIRQIMGRCDRFERTRRLSVYAFAQSNSRDSTLLESLQFLNQISN